MKKCIMFLILCAMLTGCGNTAKEAAVTTSAVSQETVIVTETASVSQTTANQNTKETKKSAETTDATAGKTSTAKTTTKKSVTKAKESGTMKRSVKESKASSETEHRRPAESIQTTAETPVENTTTKSTTASTTTTTTAKKPKQSVTKKPKPKSTTTTTTTAEEIEYIEIEDVTCLKTMVENLEDSDTPPSYYEKIGKGLKHDGTDYGKAVAVYKWMRKNGWGSCVYYSMETYFVCKGVGLECAYNFTTNNGWYGHTHNVVKVDGTWYVFDTQARRFLDNTTPCIRMFDGNDKDMAPFKEDIWYDYDENGEYRDWTLTIE